ncbi:hypothetical protein ACIGEZ_22685 [Streptomyces sp. NPDC085481]|uniref:hypothetical protein n=1 Tax=Streptomyces sp. NPDC085481 TaxID=3365727 RepID=UPI0037D958CE
MLLAPGSGDAAEAEAEAEERVRGPARVVAEVADRGLGRGLVARRGVVRLPPDIIDV